MERPLAYSIDSSDGRLVIAFDDPDAGRVASVPVAAIETRAGYSLAAS